jgi:RNA polymerase sigma factor (TIGR02999 family)
MRKPSDETLTGEQEIVGGRGRLDELFSVAYEELRRLAVAVKSGDRSATMNPTALVHEAWLKLAGSGEVAATSQMHFKRIAARAMRQLLVESARRRQAQKRGGLAVVVAMDGNVAAGGGKEEDVLRLDAALEGLAKLNRRQAELVEGRFFGGLEVKEVAAMLAISDATAERDWRAAKAWLAQEIRAVR